MKKFLTVLMTLVLLFATSALAEETTVYVSITDVSGKLVLAHEAIALTDADADGEVTINDVLACAHAQKHENGAEAYSAVPSEFGLSMLKLWGVENGGSYGYYLNNASAWSLLDPVAAGDHVKAYAFTDLAAWSDVYCFFDADTLTAAPGEVTLTLCAAGYDANWAPVTLPVEGAALLINGEVSGAVTDAQGRAVVTFAQAGEYVLSAVSDTQALVAPVCIITIESAE